MVGHSKSGKNAYDRKFYLTGRSSSESSAKVIVPIVTNLVQPRSVVDVGCGDGTWLSVFAEHGITDFIGVDGEWVDEKLLRISKDHFLAADLTKPLRMDRKFDLAISLEVAEHLPEQCAEVFVNSLVSLSPVVLFSAAIPFQGGTNHVNEQWQNYWASIFSKHDFVPVDTIRRQLWHDKDVETWYIQNSLIYVAAHVLDRYPSLAELHEKTCVEQLSIVHPRAYVDKCVSPRYKRLLKGVLRLINTIRNH
jgi:SAM-dependent methyltransferase